MRAHVVLAVFKRNFWSYFSGVIGYLFIVAFVFLGAFAAFQEKFFANNVASMDQLNEWFPQLLLFIVPAITMSIWSEERKLGTEELLFTLPVSDLEVLIGKYLAVVSVYTVALGFSLTNVVSLASIGNPDFGLIVTTYLGYWLAGCSLLAAGMVASQMTSNGTVAFVLGSAICAIPVYAGRLSFFASWIARDSRISAADKVVSSDLKFDALKTVIEGLSLSSQFKPFGMGLIPFLGLFYFCALTGLMLYINFVLIGYRHWSGGVKGTNMGLQYSIRSVSLLIILFGVGTLVSRFGFRSDLTTEQLYSFSPTTREVLKELKSDRPVTIQAFVSRMPPRDYVAVKSSLLGLLSQYGSSSNVTIRVVEVDPSSDQADEAKQFGIETRDIQFELEGSMRVEKVVMGAVINSGPNEVVIPHFGQGTPLEYELTRSIQTVAAEKRKTIGILESDAKINGGFDMSSFRSTPEWRIVSELKKSYNVETVPAAAPIDESKYDVLVSVMPSSLGNNELNNLVNYVRQGKPTLILDDPLPATNPQIAPRLPKPKPGGGNPMMSMGAQSEPKAYGGKATSLVDLLGIEWIFDEIVWDETSLNLHPEYEKLLREEIISVSTKSENLDAFNRKNPVTRGLQEVMLFFSGSIRERELKKGQEKSLDFQPLLLTGKRSGLLEWDDLVKNSMFGIQIDPNPKRSMDGLAHIIAAQITSTKDAKGDKINAIYVADTDIVSDFFFHLRETKQFKLDLDNVTFILNAVDQLAGDTATIDLRNRRPKHRTLTSVEKQTAQYIEESNNERKNAAEDAKNALKDAKKRLAEKVEKIKNNDSLDEDGKMQQLFIAQQEESRRLEVEEANINQEKEKRIDASKAKTDRLTRQVKDRYYTFALLVSPIPALMLGLIVWLIRLNNEQKDILPTRRVAKTA